MSNLMKDNVVNGNTFPSIINLGFAFLLLHHMQRMAAKTLMNVQEDLEYLENSDVSSEDDLSDNEDFI